MVDGEISGKRFEREGLALVGACDRSVEFGVIGRKGSLRAIFLLIPVN